MCILSVAGIAFPAVSTPISSPRRESKEDLFNKDTVRTVRTLFELANGAVCHYVNMATMRRKEEAELNQVKAALTREYFTLEYKYYTL